MTHCVAAYFLLFSCLGSFQTVVSRDPNHRPVNESLSGNSPPTSTTSMLIRSNPEEKLVEISRHLEEVIPKSIAKEYPPVIARPTRRIVDYSEEKTWPRIEDDLRLGRIKRQTREDRRKVFVGEDEPKEVAEEINERREQRYGPLTSTSGVVFLHQQSTNARPTHGQHFKSLKRKEEEVSAQNGHFERFARYTDEQVRFIPTWMNVRFSPSFINRVSGVFDKFAPNIRKIPSRQVAFIPPKIVYETRILPAPFDGDDVEEAKRTEIFGPVNFLPPNQGQTSPQSFRFTTGAQDNDVAKSPEDSRIPIATLNPSEEKPVDYATTFVTSAPASAEPIESQPQDIESNGDQREYNYKQYQHHSNVPVVDPLHASTHKSGAKAVFDGRDLTKTTLIGKSGIDYEAAEWEKAELSNFNHDEKPESEKHIGKNYDRYAGKYQFGYRVIDHATVNDFGHEESRDGHITNGRYHVLLPDGRIQDVKYRVDDKGYRADVTYHKTYEQVHA